MRRLALPAAAALVLAAGCGSTPIARDAGVPFVPGEGGVVIQMPAGFANVATACYRGSRIYVSEVVGGSSGRDVAVVPADPTCQDQP